MKLSPVAEEIVEAITSVIRSEAGRFGVSAIRVEPGVDHDGDPAIRVEVDYDLDGDAVDTKAIARLYLDVAQRVIDLGEERFPYIKHHFRDDQKVLERAR